MKTHSRILFAIVAALILPVAARANISLPDVISGGMVLQQRQRVPIWGKADPGEVVTVRFDSQSKKVTAAADGKWLVRLDPMGANATPSTMFIAGKNTIELKDILVGEVWLVAGQSNMQRLLRETANGDAVQAAANNPNLRLFNVRREVGFKRTGAKIGEWAACTPDSVKE